MPPKSKDLAPLRAKLAKDFSAAKAAPKPAQISRQAATAQRMEASIARTKAKREAAAPAPKA